MATVSLTWACFFSLGDFIRDVIIPCAIGAYSLLGVGRVGLLLNHSSVCGFVMLRPTFAGVQARNLEIVANLATLTEQGSLYDVLNYTKTHCGQRLLRSELLQVGVL